MRKSFRLESIFYGINNEKCKSQKVVIPQEPL